MVVPEAELVTPDRPETRLSSSNVSDRTLRLEADPVTHKWTGLTWAPVDPFHLEVETISLDPWESAERALGLDVGGDGRYAVVERSTFDHGTDDDGTDDDRTPVGDGVDDDVDE